MTDNYLQTATLAGGCFWCLEAVYDEILGVTSVESGYSGGAVKNPTYKQVCDGNTGHAEVVQVAFDPRVVTLRDLLEVFFVIQDPTTPNRQGADVGTQYRSAIFYRSPEQEQIAREVIAEMAREKMFDDPVVTQIVPFQEFFKAEDYHQDYYENNPTQGYCRAVISPKLSKFRAKFAELLRKP
jgi:peptide-methionine (S)-S-oxide reductase